MVAEMRTSMSVERGEAAEPRNEPERGKAGGGGDRELAHAGIGLEPVGRALQAVERVGRDPVERLAALGQRQRARPALEQFQAEMVLEPLDLPAHRRLRDEQLLGCLREAQCAGRRLEALEEGEMGQVIALRYHSQNSCIA
jgi:hypothetical protein